MDLKTGSREILPTGKWSKGKDTLFAKQPLIPSVEGCYTQGIGIMEDDESTMER